MLTSDDTRILDVANQNIAIGMAGYNLFIDWDKEVDQVMKRVENVE